MTWLSFDISSDFAPDKTGQIGDFIGGVVGTIFTIAGTALLFATLRLQGREHKRAHDETRNERAFSASETLLLDAQSRLSGINHGNLLGHEAVHLLANILKTKTNELHLALLTRETPVAIPNSECNWLNRLKQIYYKIEAAFLFLERPGVDPVIVLSALVDIEDLLETLRPVYFNIRAVRSTMGDCERLLKGRKGSDEEIQRTISRIWLLTYDLEDKHAGLEDRLVALQKKASDAIMEGHQTLNDIRYGRKEAID